MVIASGRLNVGDEKELVIFRLTMSTLGLLLSIVQILVLSRRSLDLQRVNRVGGRFTSGSRCVRGPLSCQGIFDLCSPPKHCRDLDRAFRRRPYLVVLTALRIEGK